MDFKENKIIEETKVIITIGENQFNRKKHQRKEFDNFQALCEFLHNDRTEKLANQYTKKHSDWISSEICIEGQDFKQDNFKKNGRIAILDFDGKLTLAEALDILRNNNLNYYIYSSTNNGRNKTEKFRIILELNRSLTNKDEIKRFYKSTNLFFGETADTNALTSCWIMYKPQLWQSTTKGQKFNPSYKEINEMNFNDNPIDVDKILRDYPVEEKVYEKIDCEDIDKIDLQKQEIFKNKAINNFNLTPIGQGLRHSALYNLALKLKSYGLDNSSINNTLQIVNNNRKNNKNVDYIMKGIENKEVSINKAVFKDEYYINFIIDKKIKEFTTIKDPIIIDNDEKISNLDVFQTNDLFVDDGINLLDSPTNSGKTYYVLNEYKNYIDKNDYIIMFVPYRTLLKELSENKNVYALMGDDKFDIEKANKHRVIVATYNKLYELANSQEYSFSFSNCHIFIDEAHNLYSSYSYRFDILNSLHNILVKHSAYKKLILLSGTFNKAYFNNDFIAKHITVKRNNMVKEKFCTIVTTTKTTVESAVNKTVEIYNEDNNRLQIIYINDKSKSNDIANSLSVNQKMKVLELNSNTVNNDTITELYKNNLIPSDINVLIMTSIGEEGLSFNNNIYAIHTIGEVDSTVAEQLGNRPRKYSTKLFIHRKEKKSKNYVLNNDYNLLQNEYNKKMKLISADIMSNQLIYENRKSESFYKFTIWDEINNNIEFSDLTISFDLYELDKINEFNYYDYYFIKKMEYYGWDIQQALDLSNNDIRIQFTKLDNIDKYEILKDIIKLYKSFFGSRSSSADMVESQEFVEFVKLRTNKYSDTLLENVFNDYGYLSQYITDEDIYEALNNNNRNNKTINRLFKHIENEKSRQNGTATRMYKWLEDNIVIGKTYKRDELTRLSKLYNEEEKKYVVNNYTPLSLQKFNSILADYFIINKYNKTVNKVTQQVTEIISLVKLEEKKELDYIEISNQIKFNEVIFDDICNSDNPQDEITLEEYNQLLNDDIELNYLCSTAEPKVKPIHTLNKWL